MLESEALLAILANRKGFAWGLLTILWNAFGSWVSK